MSAAPISYWEFEALLAELGEVPDADRIRWLAERQVDGRLAESLLDTLRSEESLSQAFDARSGLGDAASLVARAEGLRGTPGLPDGLELVRRIDGGGGGDVWLVRQRSPERLAAVKVLDPRGAGRQLAETDLPASLVHEGIVRIHQVGDCRDGAGRPARFILMEYVEGESLRTALDRRQAGAGADGGNGPAPPVIGARIPRSARELRQVLAWFRDLALAVAHAHDRHVVHGDIKPSNVMVRIDGRPVLLDFGLGVRLDSDGSHPAIGHTLPYAAPEVLEHRTLSRASDTWSLGVVLYEALTGEHPFGGGACLPWAEPRESRRVNPAVDRNVSLLLERALSPEPADRYAAARELASDLDRAISGRPIRGRRPGIAERVRLGFRRHPWAAVLAGVLIALAGVIHGLWRARELEQANRLWAESDTAFRRGAWDESIERARMAAALGGIDAARIENRLADAFLAKDDLAGALAWARDRTTDASASVRSKAWLVLGDVSPDPPAVRREHLRRARDCGGLDRGDSLYLDALLAGDLPAIAKSLFECLTVQPDHFRALSADALIQFLLGNHVEARRRAEALAVWAPYDGTVRVFVNAVDVAEGRIPDSTNDPPRDPMLPWELLHALEDIFRSILREGLDGNLMGRAFNQARLVRLFKAGSSRWSARTGQDLSTDPDRLRLPIPPAVEELLQRILRSALSLPAHGAEFRAAWPIALFSHLEGVGHWNGGRYTEARKCFARSLDEPDLFPRLRAARARCLLQMCEREFLDARDSGSRLGSETADAIRLGVRTFLDAAGKEDCSVDACTELSHVFMRIHARGLNCSPPIVPSDEDLSLYFRIFDRWRREYPAYPRRDLLDRQEAIVFTYLGAPARAAEAMRRWEAQMDREKDAEEIARNRRQLEAIEAAVAEGRKAAAAAER